MRRNYCSVVQELFSCAHAHLALTISTALLWTGLEGQVGRSAGERKL